jgi:hypothetical protein
MAFYSGGVAFGVGGVAVYHGKESNVHSLLIFRHDEFGVRCLISVSRQNVRRDDGVAEGAGWFVSNFFKRISAS